MNLTGLHSQLEQVVLSLGGRHSVLWSKFSCYISLLLFSFYSEIWILLARTWRLSICRSFRGKTASSTWCTWVEKLDYVYGHNVNVQDFFDGHLSSLIVSQCCPFSLQSFGHPSSSLHTLVALKWTWVFGSFLQICLIDSFISDVEFSFNDQPDLPTYMTCLHDIKDILYN